jgi:sporulation related protein
MHSRLFFFLAALLLSATSSTAFSQSDLATSYFTLQVASFPETDLANRFVVQLVSAGEHPACSTVELNGRGSWTRVFVGLFKTTDQARLYGESLVARGIIKEFLVRKADLNQSAIRPRRVTRNDSYALTPITHSTVPVPSGARERILDDERAVTSSLPSATRAGTSSVKVSNALTPRAALYSAGITLPVFEARVRDLAPFLDPNLIPRPDPVTLAFKLINGEARTSSGEPKTRGGLWVTGDTAEGLSRLRWILGEENAGLIKLDIDGRVKLDKEMLARVAGLGEARVEDPLRLVDYISSNEGLLLVVQLLKGSYRYRIHIGRQAPTLGKDVQITGSINVDNNFDSRINPYRKNGKKLDCERPPEGFDSLVALNPIARWFNLSTNAMVPVGEITFHELAEAYAKLEQGFDYLEQGSRQGAHALALERERRLKTQRPEADIVLTAGSNRVLRTEQEIRLFYAEAPAGVSQR